MRTGIHDHSIIHSDGSKTYRVASDNGKWMAEPARSAYGNAVLLYERLPESQWHNGIERGRFHYVTVDDTLTMHKLPEYVQYMVSEIDLYMLQRDRKRG